MIVSEPEWRVSTEPVSYPDAVKAMERRVDEILLDARPEQIWLLEHPPLYTAGTSAVPSELKDATRFPVFETGRGGRYTYHGPGQRIVYAMIDLRKRGRDVRAHVFQLEEWLIGVLKDFSIHGERRSGRVGIWVAHQGREEKIAAIGVRVRRWVAFHGLALNLDPDLSHFSGITPCGLEAFAPTSLRKLGSEATMEQIDAAFRRQNPFV